MTNLKKLVVLGALVVAVASTSVMAFAVSVPATSTDYSLEEVQESMLERKIAILEERVANGTMTQEEADEIINALKENQLTCDGTGEARIGQSFGAAFGMMGNNQGSGLGLGRGFGGGQGRGMGGNGFGNGLGLRDGSCLIQE